MKIGSVEQVWCRDTIGSDKILVGCIYRPEKNEERDEVLLALIKTANDLVLSGTHDSLLIAVDFKMGSINWSDSYGFLPNDKSFEGYFVETLDTCFLSQCVDETTFRKGLDNHIGSLLDLMITDSKARVLNVKNQAALCLSRSHSILIWKFAVGRMSNEFFHPSGR